MKRLLALTGLLISIACLFFFGRTMAHHWQAISSAPWGFATWMTFALATAMYIGTYGLISFAWSRSLTALGQTLRFRTVLRILAVSQFAKYLPGNVGQHVGRLVLAKRAHVPAEVVLGSMVLDTLIVLAAASIWSLWVFQLLLKVVQSHGEAIEHAAIIITAIGVVGVAMAFLLPVVRRAMARQIRHLKQLVQIKNLPLLTAAWIAHTLSVVTGGTALYLLCTSLSQGAVAAAWTVVSGVYASAWLLGFLLPGAPAGLGIRELVLMLGLGPVFGNEVATAAAATMRLVTTLGDGIVFGVGLMLSRGDSDHNTSANALI